MYIGKLEIKGFGRFCGLTLELSKGLNIIYGSNESGKSTLQWFIKAMLFGLKGGRVSRDGLPPPLKRFRPWSGTGCSGIMEYGLDDGRLFRVERDFDNNTIEIYDSSFNNISGTFDTNREKGLLFGERLLGMNETCFEKTVMIKQMETRLDDDGSRELSSRLANVSQTGFEDISFKKAEKVLKDTLKSYVGTDRTTTQPVDIVNSRLMELEAARVKLSAKKDSLFEMERKLDDAVNSKREMKKRKEFLIKIKELIDGKKRLDEYKTIQEELKLSFGQLQEAEAKLASAAAEMGRERNTAGIRNNRKKKTGILLLFFAGVFLFAAGFFINALFFIFSILLLVPLIMRQGGRFLFVARNATNENRPPCRIEEIMKLNGRLKDIYSNASLAYGKHIGGIPDMEKALYGIAEDIAITASGLQSGISAVKQAFDGVTGDFFEAGRLDGIIYESSPNWLADTWEYDMERVNGCLDDAALTIRECETILKSDHEDGDELQNIDEEMAALKLRKDELDRTGSALKLALEVLSEASSEIRRNISPVLNTALSRIIGNLTGKRYNDLRVDDGLALKTVSPDTGDVKSVLSLSGGTVDQMYLALRLAISDLLASSGEGLPLLMDEVFSQYDDTRTRQAFEYLKKEYGGRQIILFTCKRREMEIAREVAGDGINMLELPAVQDFCSYTGRSKTHIAN